MYDLETTGLSKKDHIIEIGAIYVNNGTIQDTFSSLCNPGILINQRISEITNITNDMLKDKKSEIEVIRSFVNWVQDKKTDICVGHNINKFDNRMLKVATQRAKTLFPFQRTLDTLDVAKKAHLKKDGLISSEKQEELAKYYGISYSAHRAINDVEALYQIFQNLQQKVKDLPILPID